MLLRLFHLIYCFVLSETSYFMKHRLYLAPNLCSLLSLQLKGFRHASGVSRVAKGPNPPNGSPDRVQILEDTGSFFGYISPGVKGRSARTHLIRGHSLYVDTLDVCL